MNELENTLNKTIKKLDTLSEKSPQLCCFWKNYLTIKKTDLEKQIDYCNTIITMIENENIEIPISTIITLYTINNLHE